MVFHVFVDGVTAVTPGAMRALAGAMAAHYGVAADELYARLTRGPFRVKANVDRETAETYARDLQQIGAQVRIEPVSAAPASQPPALEAGGNIAPAPAPTWSARPAAAIRGAPPIAVPSAARVSKSGLPALPPQPARPTKSGLSALPPAPSAKPSRSGLTPPTVGEVAPSASRTASAHDIAVALNAFDGSDLSLALLDNAPPPSRSAPASFAPTSIAAAPPTRPKDEPIDMFAPPALEDSDLDVELADDEIAYRAARTATPVSSLPPPAPAPEPPLAVSPAALATPGFAAPSAALVAPATSALAPAAVAAEPTIVSLPPPAKTWLSDPRVLMVNPRVRFATGVLLAILLGWLPADLISHVQERSAMRSIDSHVIATQTAADTQAAYDDLDAFRSDQLAAKRSQRFTIELTSLLIWAAASSAIAYVWFRRVRWLDEPAAAPAAS